MARYLLRHIRVSAVVLAMLALVIQAAPPGIANNPSQARCMDDRYKECKNLVHVCPKFCPNSCSVNCVSCKPVCGNWTSPPDLPSPPPPPVSQTPPTASPPPPVPSSNPTPPPSAATPSPLPSSNSTPPPVSQTPQTASPPPPVPSSNPTPPPSQSPPATSPPSPLPSSNFTPPPQSPSTTTPPPPPSNSTPHSPSESSSTPPPPPPLPSSSPTPPPSVPSSGSTPPPSPPVTSAPPPPLTDTSGEQRVRCRDRNYPLCYGRLLQCPSSCPKCFVDCNTCKAVCQCDYPGAVCQDPRFIGGDGITFYFHGKKDHDFCLVSDPDLHINAHFIGKRNMYMKRDFTWVQSIGVLFGNHRLFVGARKTATWDDSIDHLVLSFNGQQILVPEADGASWQSKSRPTVSITRVGGDTDIVMVEVEGKLGITAKVVPITEQESRVHSYDITQDDCFAHLDLRFKFYSLSNGVDGILGQTYKPGYMSWVKIGARMPVMGGEDKFSASGLFDADCALARFGGSAKGQPDGEATILELPSLGCTSRIDGKGIVCKK